MSVKVRSSEQLYFALSGADILGCRFFASDYYFSLTSQEKPSCEIARADRDELVFADKYIYARINDRFIGGTMERRIESTRGISFALSLPSFVRIAYLDSFAHAGKKSPALMLCGNCEPPNRHILILLENCEFENYGDSKTIRALGGEAMITILPYPRVGDESYSAPSGADRPAHKRAVSFTSRICPNTLELSGLFDVLRDSLSLIYSSFDEVEGIIPGIAELRPIRSVTYEAALALQTAGDRTYALKIRNHLDSLERAHVTLIADSQEGILSEKAQIKEALAEANASILCNSLPFRYDDAELLFGELPCDILTHGSCRRTKMFIDVCSDIISFCQKNSLDTAEFGVDEAKYKKVKDAFNIYFLRSGTLFANLPAREAKASPRTLFGVCPLCSYRGYLLRLRDGAYLCPMCAQSKESLVKYSSTRSDPSCRYRQDNPYLILGRHPSEDEIGALCSSSFCLDDSKGVYRAAVEIRAIAAFMKKA